MFILIRTEVEKGPRDTQAVLTALTAITASSLCWFPVLISTGQCGKQSLLYLPLHKTGLEWDNHFALFSQTLLPAIGLGSPTVVWQPDLYSVWAINLPTARLRTVLVAQSHDSVHIICIVYNISWKVFDINSHIRSLFHLREKQFRLSIPRRSPTAILVILQQYSGLLLPFLACT